MGEGRINFADSAIKEREEMRKVAMKTQMFSRRGTDSISLASSTKGMKQLIGELMSSKNFADVRVKAGEKKPGDHFGKSLKLSQMKWLEEVESVPSEIGND